MTTQNRQKSNVIKIYQKNLSIDKTATGLSKASGMEANMVHKMFLFIFILTSYFMLLLLHDIVYSPSLVKYEL